MREYELLLIIDPNLEDTETESLIERVKSNIESNGGEALKVDPWGKKPLAFPIKKNNDGYFVLFIFRSEPAFIPQLSASFRVIESIIRHMVALFEGDLDKDVSPKEERAARDASAPSRPKAEDEQTPPKTESEEASSTSESPSENQVGEASAPDNS